MRKRPAPMDATIAPLVGLRDDLAAANSLIIAAWLAAQSPSIGANEREVLCAVTDAARDHLESVIAGTLLGGWRIVHTMGSKITRLTPMQGFCAETGGAITLFGATLLGIPVLTTHTITGAIVGVGSARRTSAVRLGVARSIVIAWVVTIPASALIAASFYWLAVKLF